MIIGANKIKHSAKAGVRRMRILKYIEHNLKAETEDEHTKVESRFLQVDICTIGYK